MASHRCPLYSALLYFSHCVYYRHNCWARQWDLLRLSIAESVSMHWLRLTDNNCVNVIIRTTSERASVVCCNYPPRSAIDYRNESWTWVDWETGKSGGYMSVLCRLYNQETTMLEERCIAVYNSSSGSVGKSGNLRIRPAKTLKTTRIHAMMICPSWSTKWPKSEHFWFIVPEHWRPPFNGRRESYSFATHRYGALPIEIARECAALIATYSCESLPRTFPISNNRN